MRSLYETLLGSILALGLFAGLAGCQTVKDSPRKRLELSRKSFNTTAEVTIALIKNKKVDKETAKGLYFWLVKADSALDRWEVAVKKGHSSVSYEVAFKEAIKVLEDYNKFKIDIKVRVP